MPGSIENVNIPVGADYIINDSTLTVNNLNIGANETLTVSFEAVLAPVITSGTIVLNQGQPVAQCRAVFVPGEPTVGRRAVVEGIHAGVGQVVQALAEHADDTQLAYRAGEWAEQVGWSVEASDAHRDDGSGGDREHRLSVYGGKRDGAVRALGEFWSDT